MYPIHRILVAIKDPRAREFPVLAKAAQLARAFNAEVCLFHGMSDPIYADLVTLNGKSLSQIEDSASAAYYKRVERLAKRLRRRGVKVTTQVEWDFPAHEAVIRAAVRFGAELIVVDCHRAAHVAPWLLHFTDWELLRNSTIPVLLVKNRRAYRKPNVLAAVDPGHEFDKPATLDDEILRFGGTIADALHGALHAVHAYNPLLIGATARELAAPNGIAEAQAKAAARAHALVDPKLAAMGIARARRHVVDGFAIDVIEQVTRKIHAGILVMGAVSRSGWRRLFIGNTAERMLDRINCDILIVKPRQFRNRIARARRGVQLITAPMMPGV